MPSPITPVTLSPVADFTIIEGGKRPDEPERKFGTPWSCPACRAAGERAPDVLHVVYAGAVFSDGRSIRLLEENRLPVLVCPYCAKAGRSAPGMAGVPGGVARWEPEEQAWRFVYDGNR